MSPASDTGLTGAPESPRDTLLRIAPLAGVGLVAVVGGALNGWVLDEACKVQCTTLEASSDPQWVLVPALEYSGATLVFSLLGIVVLVAAVRGLVRHARATMRHLATAGAIILLAAVLGLSVTRLLEREPVLPDGVRDVFPMVMGNPIGWLVVGSGVALLGILALQVWHRRDARRDEPERRMRAALTGLAVVIPTATISPLFNVSGLREKILDATLYHPTGENLDATSLGAALETSVGAMSFLGLVAVGVLALLMTTLPRPRGPATHRIVRLRQLVTEVRWLLVGASVFLVFGVIQVHAVYEWGFGLAAEGPDPDTVRALTTAITGLSGVFYTAFLVAVFGPPLLLLRRWTRELAQEQADAEKAARSEADLAEGAASADSGEPSPHLPVATPVEVQDWLDEQSLEIGWPRAAFTALGMLAPLLAGGPASVLLETVIH